MVWTLVQKDIVRFRRNWITVLILLAVPLGITGLIGVTFGPTVRDGDSEWELIRKHGRGFSNSCAVSPSKARASCIRPTIWKKPKRFVIVLVSLTTANC